jgi:hypothetical protein
VSNTDSLSGRLEILNPCFDESYYNGNSAKAHSWEQARKLSLTPGCQLIGHTSDRPRSGRWDGLSVSQPRNQATPNESLDGCLSASP